ncbi:MAG: diacylglycerol kinase family protein [Deltaproteobacteria bacterium]|nr:diacylglycerol kinase family protein [Deltaproteobacteria bacterium]
MTQATSQEAAPFQPKSGLVAVFSAAYNGLLHTVSVQRNMKIHWISGFMVMLVGMALEFDLTARAALYFSVFLILFAEILNSALEAFVDLHIKQYAYQAKLAKDASAAGVLVLACAIVVLFADILWQYRTHIAESGTGIVRTLVCGLPAVFAMGVLLFAVTGKGAKLALAAGMFAGLSVLVAYSHDQYFSLAAAGFIWVSFHSRWRFPDGTR